MAAASNVLGDPPISEEALGQGKDPRANPDVTPQLPSRATDLQVDAVTDQVSKCRVADMGFENNLLSRQDQNVPRDMTNTTRTHISTRGEGQDHSVTNFKEPVANYTKHVNNYTGPVQIYHGPPVKPPTPPMDEVDVDYRDIFRYLQDSTRQIREDDIVDIYQEIGAFWYKLGLALGVKHAKLQCIEERHYKYIDEKAHGVLMVWIQERSDGATIGELTKAFMSFQQKSDEQNQMLDIFRCLEKMENDAK